MTNVLVATLTAVGTVVVWELLRHRVLALTFIVGLRHALRRVDDRAKVNALRARAQTLELEAHRLHVAELEDWRARREYNVTKILARAFRECAQLYADPKGTRVERDRHGEGQGPWP